jgi:hypothetical protein
MERPAHTDLQDICFRWNKNAKPGQLGKQITRDYQNQNEIFKNWWLYTQKVMDLKGIKMQSIVKFIQDYWTNLNKM